MIPPKDACIWVPAPENDRIWRPSASPDGVADKHASMSFKCPIPAGTEVGLLTAKVYCVDGAWDDVVSILRVVGSAAWGEFHGLRLNRMWRIYVSHELSGREVMSEPLSFHTYL